jgi:hypothetical protein
MCLPNFLETLNGKAVILLVVRLYSSYPSMALWASSSVT